MYSETKSSRPDQTGPSQPIILFSWLFVITNVLLMILYPQSVVFMIAVFYKQFVKSFLSFFKQTGKVLVCVSKPHFSQMCQRSQFSVTILRTHFRWYKGSCHLRFSGFCPLRGYPPPTPLTENQCEKKKVFFLSGKGGYPHPPLNGKSAKLFREIFS